MDQNEKNEEIKEENHVQPENGISKEQPALDDQIDRKISEMQKEHGEKFDDKGFRAAAKKQAEEKGTIEGVSAESFVQKDKDGPNRDSGGKSYQGGWENGKFVWKGPNGERIEGKDYAEAEDKFHAAVAENAKKKGEEPKVGTYWGAGIPESEKKKEQKISSKAAVKHGVTIIAGWSEDKQFWQDLKADYLKDEKHTLADWERMTRKIPDDVLSRTPEESARNKKLNDAEILKQMRRGNNPYLTPQENKPQQPLNKPQAANNKDLTIDQIKAMSGRGGIGG